jgi:hypothetical protein
MNRPGSYHPTTMTTPTSLTQSISYGSYEETLESINNSIHEYLYENGARGHPLRSTPGEDMRRLTQDLHRAPLPCLFRHRQEYSTS